MVADDRSVGLPRCRACGSDLRDRLIDLGAQPDPDQLLDPADDEAAPTAPIDLWLCRACCLVQLAGQRPSGPVPRHGHQAGGPPDAAPWPVDLLLPGLGTDRIVVDVDVADARTGRAFARHGFPVHGFSRHPDLGRGTDPWIATSPFDPEAAEALGAGGTRAGVIIASHALAHADDPDALVAAIARILAPDGVVAIEFHHVVGLVEGQFDVLSHAHRSYFSVGALENLLHRHGLTIRDAERVATFGGTIRALATRKTTGTASAMVQAAGSALLAIRQSETEARVCEPAGYAALPDQVARATTGLVEFLERSRAEGRRVAGYGAPPRGTVLLNIAGVDTTLLPYTVDRDPDKQGWALPGCRIPIHAPSAIDSGQPDDILVLPWPIADEIRRQLVTARDLGTRFAVAMPALRIL